MKQFFILFLTSSLIIAQKTEDKFFSSNETLEAKISFTPKTLKKSIVDTVYFDTNFAYKIDNSFQEMEIGIRARGNFRRSTCYYPPIKVDFKKKQTKGTVFEGHKKMKLVLPCLKQKDKNDNILKEYIVYKLFEMVYPYHFKTRRLSLEFTDLTKKKKPVVEKLNAFLIEDDKKVAQLHNGKVFERFIPPLAMDADASVRNAMFQYMIGNTDFSTAYQHNNKLLYIDKLIIPLPYDFDMSGFINPSYAVVNETLNINNIRQRKYRGFKRDKDVFYKVRDIFIEKKSDMLSLIKSFEADFDNESEYEEAIEYIESFFNIIEDDKKFTDNVVLAARTK